jgi:hypothetical protein
MNEECIQNTDLKELCKNENFQNNINKYFNLLDSITKIDSSNYEDKYNIFVDILNHFRKYIFTNIEYALSKLHLYNDNTKVDLT